MALQEREDLVTRYFDLVRQLRGGSLEAVEQIIDLWDEDGVFEFAGAPPVVGVFKGRNAIHALYKNRAQAAGMPIRTLEAERSSGLRDTALGIVDTRVHRGRSLDRNPATDTPERVAVGWTTVIGTQDRRGFEVSGNHTFVFKGDKIASLKVVVSPKPDLSEGLQIEGLHVEDIGRLSLAAWAVV
jgi:hypothetical protein